uniref:Nucleolar pre-ribosomal-associated protein 1 C-terminal domain-containing protein n=1 Tax=Pygocentrus nattereri TaxID=42514 RepID=A0AAR2JVE7_PYGNA
MAKKRQNAEPLESLMPANKKKTTESEFNGTVFKSMLKDPSSAFKGLEIFIRTAKKLPCANLYDVVEGYIKISAECSEILLLLEGDTHSETELMLIFQSLEMIFLRTASDLSHFTMVGSTVVKKIVSTHMKLLQSSLCSVNRQFVQQCLRLLAAMVSQGADSAREIFSSLVYTKTLSSLARIRDKTVVHNTAISKSQKVRFFSASTLAQIASLYRWNGILDTTTFHSQVKLLVRDLVHNFLLDVCCSHKYGISFHDPSLGTAMRAGNIVLLQFVVGLKQAAEDDLLAELLVSILKCNPDILPRYFKETHFSFTPRMKGAWLDSIALLKKIYQAQPEVSQAFQLQEMLPVPRLLSMVLVTSLPPVCNKTFFTQGLKVKHVVGQQVTLSVLVFILRRAQKNIEYSLKRPVWDGSDSHSPTSMEEFVQLYREALSKVLPDVISIVSMWQSLSKKEKEEGEENTGEQDPALIQFKALLLQVLRLYHSVVPHFISQSKFDFSKLLQVLLTVLGIVSVKEMRNEVPPVLQYQILQLALELPASKFSWFRFQDGVNPGPARGEVSVFYQLLKMFISSSSSSHLRTSTRKLVLKVLKDSGVFEHTWRELELWVDHLLPLEPSQQEEAIQFLDQVLMKVVCNPYEYMDKVVAMVQETVCLQAEMSGQNRGTGTLPNSVFADMEDRGKGTEKTGSSLTDVLQTFPFSALVPAVLEARNKLLVNVRDEKAVLCEYMCAALCDILHSQRDPLTLCLTLQHYDKELLSAENSRPPHSCLTSFCLYYSQWLPQKPEETWVRFTGSFFLIIFFMCYSEGPDAFLRDSFKSALERSMSTLQLSQFTGAVTQVLLYLKSFVDAFSMLPKGQAAEVVGCVLEVLGAVLHNLHSTAETTPNQSEPHSVQIPELVNLNLFSAVFQVLLFVFNSVFTHPVLQQWFLAVELDVVPHHSLEVDRVRQLCVQLTQGVLNLLLSFAETVKALNALELISPYLSAAHQAMLKELQHSGRCLNEESQSVKAFLALYDYMEPSSVNEVLSALLLLPQSSLLADGDKLSLYGHAVLKVLTKSSAPPGKINTLYLSSENLRSLATLYTSCHSAQLENVLLQVLQREPWNAKLVPTDVLLHCLQQCSNLDLAALLVQNCSTHCLSFELWCLEQSDLADITAKNNSFLCLLTSYIRQAVTLDPCRPKDIQNTVLQMLTKTFLTELLSSALQMEAGVSLDQRMEILSSLIQLGDMAPELYQLISDLPANLKKPENYERWQLADSITEKLANTPEELHWRESLLTAALHWLSTTYKEQKTPQFTKEEVMLKRLKTLLISPENLKAVDWNVFVKSGLKYRYQDQRFLVTFNTLLELVYKNVNASKELLAIEALHMMVTSHSLFLPTMLSSQNETDSIPECKEALVSLLLTLVKKCPEVCNSNHFPVLLAAYGATLNPTDQKLLLLLQEYEKKNISLVEFQCLLWGPAAMNYQKTRKCLGPSLWQQPSSEQLLAQLAADRMLNTVALFPLHRRLVPQVICTEETKVTPDKLCLYDPCFLLPLFSFILRPESVVDCQKFVSCHALGVTVVALSSYDHKMRSAAYHVLCSFYEHLEGAHFREKKQLLYLLDTVKNGIQKQNLKVPFVHTTYIAKVAQQILRPEDHLYPVINRFLLGTQCVDLNRVPDFFRLFYSFDLEHKLERDWMLNVLEEGMMDRLSFNLCEQQSIYHTLLGFCSSPLCDQHIQIQIMNILRKSAHVIRAAYDLTKAHGVLTWIIQITEKRCLNGKLLSAVIGLLHSLWFTNLGEKESSRLGVQSTRAADQQGDGSAKCFPLPIISDYLYALLSVIRHLRSGVEIKELQWFLQTLGSVLRHQKMSLGAYEDAGWLTMHPHNLSCTAVLRLIHCWGTLTHDKALLFDLHDLAYKHKTDKEKIRGKVSSKPSQSCLEHLCDVADGPLDECKSMLMNILTNWEPWHVLPNPNLRSSDFPDSSSLICATAHNILKWILKTLSEMSYDQSNTCTVLKWLQSVLLSYKTIADSLLSNEAMRVHLLRLYHQTCEHRLHEKSISKLDAVELFTSIMMHLLEVERSSEALHKSMIKACLHTTTDEGPKREAGLKLLSLYIHELWSGAKVPQLLLTHAKLVTRDRKKSQKSSKSPVVHLCKDILSALDSVFIT